MAAMQPVDREDPRPPNEQIAASIRAAILNGELQPGERLASGHDLAAQFGVQRGTVLHALGKLSDEGYVRSVNGSGTYVRDQVSLPVLRDGEHELSGAAAFLFEMGQLKNTPRSGWLLLGIRQPESVAEHSFRVAMAGMILAAIDGADVGRTVALCVFHDGHESRIGDVPSVGRAYVRTADPEAVTVQQTAGMPEPVAATVQAMTAEYEATETPESRLAHDADKIETLLQAAEYRSQGYDTAGWRATSLAALRTEAGKQLAQAIDAADPHGWFAAFQASYAELRASTRAARQR